MDDYKFIVFFGVAVKGVKLNDLRDGEYSEWTRVHFSKAPNRYDSDCVAVTVGKSLATWSEKQHH